VNNFNKDALTTRYLLTLLLGYTASEYGAINIHNDARILTMREKRGREGGENTKFELHNGYTLLEITR
jgi:hypothetical protein